MKQTNKKNKIDIRKTKQDLLGKLQHLRSSVRVTTQNYQARMEADILELGEFVHRVTDRHGSHVKWIAQKLDRIAIKPEKGKRKDLRKIEEALSKIRRRIEKKRS